MKVVQRLAAKFLAMMIVVTMKQPLNLKFVIKNIHVEMASANFSVVPRDLNKGRNMTWFAFKGYNNGKAVDVAGSQEKEAVVLGFHGYATEPMAEHNPNDVASFPNPLALVQKPFVNGIIADYNQALKQGSQPGGPNANILNPATAVKAGVTGLAHDIPGVGSIDDALNWIKNNAESFFLRMGEITVGVLLVYIGVKAMTSPAGQQVGTRTFKQTAKAGAQFATGRKYKAYKTVKASRGG